MLQFLFDTDHLTLFDHGHAAIGNKFSTQSADSVGLSVVTVEEVMRGRLGALRQAQTGAERIARYDLLMASIEIVRQFPIVVDDQRAEDQFQKLKLMRLQVGSQDLRIGSMAMVNQLTLLTRNRSDFSAIPGLLLDDWSA